MNESYPVTLVEVEGSSGTAWALSLPRSVLRETGLQDRDLLSVHTGPGHRWKLRIQSRDTESCIRLPLRLTRQKGEYVLGPLLGILTNDRDQSFGGNRANFRDIAQTAEERRAVVVVFTPRSMRGRLSTVAGWVRSEGNWRRAVLPLPAVVYNRIPNRVIEQQKSVAEAKRLLKKRTALFFNPDFFNKDDIDQWLGSEKPLREHIPETTRLKSCEQLTRWIRKHPLIYVKPVYGKAGHRMVQILREGNDTHLVIQAHGKRQRRTFTDLQAAANACWSYTQGRPYVVQQGIRLATYQRRIYDLRVLLQKDFKGTWGITGIGARVAAPDGITTHVPNGGHIASTEDVLRHSFGEKSYDIDETVRQIAQRCAVQIDGRVDGDVQEMSVDIGLDERGHPWVFEANAKPMKFDERDIRVRSLNHLVDLADKVYGM